VERIFHTICDLQEDEMHIYAGCISTNRVEGILDLQWSKLRMSTGC
jgi:hypothetical protein